MTKLMIIGVGVSKNGLGIVAPEGQKSKRSLRNRFEELGNWAVK